jgi:membrane protease subunit HflK
LERRVRTSLISIGTNILLTCLKGILAFLSGSLAILADAYHSFSDLIVSCTVLIGVLLRLRSERKAGAPTAGSPSSGAETTPPSSTEGVVPGYWIESLVAYFVALLILYTAYEVVSKVIVGPPGLIRNVWIAVVGVTVCVAITCLLARYKIMVGRETDSPALVADGYHSRMDMFTSIAVVLSIMGQWIGIPLDRVVAILIAVMLAITGVNLFISSFVSFFRKSPVDVRGIWEIVFSFLNWAVGLLSEQLFRRRISLPEIDFSRLRPKEWLSRRLGIGLAVVLVLIYLASGIRTVKPDETGVRFRFGAILDSQLDPGLHLALPWPFEKVIKVNAKRVYRVEVGFRTDPGLLLSDSMLIWETKHLVKGYHKMFEESVSFLGDENLVDSSMVVHYRPLDAVVHLFKVNRIHEVMRGLAESFIREVLATQGSRLLMTDNRSHLLKRIKQMLGKEVDRLGLGVEVVAVFCHDLHPPLDTVSAYRDVFSAREDHARYINEAESYRNQELPRARAKSEKELADALAYKIEKKVKAEGDAQKFLLRAKAHEQAPDVTGYRLYMETIEQGLAGKKKYIANPRANLGGYRLWLFTPGAPPGGS